MIRLISILFFLYLTSLHTSIAGMEIFSWALVLAGVGLALREPGWRSQIRQFVRQYRVPLVLLATLWIWVTISLLSSPLERTFLEQFGFMRWTLLLPAFALLLRRVWSPEFEKNLVRVWAGVAFVVAIYALAQFLFGIDLIRPGKDMVKAQAGGIFKAVGFFSMSLSYAYVFGQSALSIGGIVIRNSDLRLKVITFLLFAGGLVASMSRGAWLASIVVLGLFLLVEKRKWLIPFVAVMGIGLFGASKLQDAVGSKIQDMANLKVDHSSALRLDIWKAYRQMFFDHPITGVGLFDGDRLVPEYYAKLGIDQTFASHAHNNYLQWLAGTGIVGFALFVALGLYFLILGWQIRDSLWGWGLLLSHLFWQIGGLTECNFFDGEVNHFIIFTWALTWALHASQKDLKTS